MVVAADVNHDSCELQPITWIVVTKDGHEGFNIGNIGWRVLNYLI